MARGGISSRRSEFPSNPSGRSTDIDIGNIRSNSPVAPERNLIAAVLARAIADITLSHETRSSELYRWITDDPEDATPFTFNWCCHLLELNSREVRIRCLRLFKEAEIEKEKTKRES